MVEEQLFVRIRGHIQGPYTAEKLRTLVRRGQLSRMHEVSADRNVWKQASEYPDLFASSAVAAVRVHGENQRSDELLADTLGLEPPSVTHQGSWFYACDGAQKGPVSFEQLNTLLHSGSLSPDDLVWTDGMSEWMPARTVRGLGSGSPIGMNNDNGTVSKERIGGELIRTLTETRPWISFIAIYALTVGVLLLISGALAIVLGARRSRIELVSGGGFLILYAIVCLWGGQLLSSYNRSAQNFLRDSSSRKLDLTFRSLRRFWIFTSIILIVVLVNFIGVLIWGFSVGLILMG